MSKRKRGVRGSLLNLALVVVGLAAAVLLYAFVAGSFLDSKATASRSRSINPVREVNPADLVGEIIQIEVRNGCGVPGLAARLTEYLRDRGFDVVNTGNYRSFGQEKTVVFDRVGNPAAAHKVAEALGLPASRVEQAIRPELYLDASVVIGADYETLKPFSTPPEE